MNKTMAAFLVRSMLLSLFFLLGSFRIAHAQADLIIATNAEIVVPSTVEELTYFYFFTVADDGGGISTPVITNLAYDMGAVNQIDVYDSGEFTYATFEVAVTVTPPGAGESSNDCFTITYEGESVNPCFDVTTAARQVPTAEEIVQICVNKENGLVRIVKANAKCRTEEYRAKLVVPPVDTASAAKALGVPSTYRTRGQ